MPAMATRRINRYIISEVLTPTLLGLVIFTFILIMGRLPDLTELVVNKGVPLVDILQLFYYLLPNFLTITIPLAFLLGILLAFGRLSADSEFIALKSTGVSLYALLAPVLVLALLGTFITAALNLYGKPLGKTAFRDHLFTIASDRASAGLESGIFNDRFENLVIYAEQVDERNDQMRKVFLSDERSAKSPANIFAEQGRFIRNPRQQTLVLRLSKGTIHYLATDQSASYQTIAFSTYDVNLNISHGLEKTSERERAISELTPEEILAARKKGTHPGLRHSLDIELHKRISTSMTPFVFALIGIPLALQANRSGKGAGFAMALAISLGYYVLLSLARTLADKALIPPFIILYLPNLVFLSGGLFFIYRTATEKPVSVLLPPFKTLLSRLQGGSK